MNIKSTAIIILTLLIGFALGALSTGRLVESQVHHLQQMRETPMHDLIGTIEPEEAQLQTLAPAIEKYQTELITLNRENRLLIRTTVDAFLGEIDSLLTGEQKERLAERRKLIREREKKGLPPPPPPFRLWRPRREFELPPKSSSTDSLTTQDSLPPLRRPGLRKFPPRPAPLDSVQWRKHLQERLQTPPDTNTMRQLRFKKKQGIPFTAQDSAQWQIIRRHQRLHRAFGNDSLRPFPPPRPHRPQK